MRSERERVSCFVVLGATIVYCCALSIIEQGNNPHRQYCTTTSYYCFLLGEENFIVSPMEVTELLQRSESCFRDTLRNLKTRDSKEINYLAKTSTGFTRLLTFYKLEGCFHLFFKMRNMEEIFSPEINYISGSPLSRPTVGTL